MELKLYVTPIDFEVTNYGEGWVTGTATICITADPLPDREHPQELSIPVGAALNSRDNWVAADRPGDFDAALTGPLEGLRRLAPTLAADLVRDLSSDFAGYVADCGLTPATLEERDMVRAAEAAHS